MKVELKERELVVQRVVIEEVEDAFRQYDPPRIMRWKYMRIRRSLKREGDKTICIESDLWIVTRRHNSLFRVSTATRMSDYHGLVTLHDVNIRLARIHGLCDIVPFSRKVLRQQNYGLRESYHLSVVLEREQS